MLDHQHAWNAETLGTANRSRHPWTPDEDALVIDCRVGELAVLALQLNRTFYAVLSLRQRLRRERNRATT